MADHEPRVARASQPWAEWFNPFGIGNRTIEPARALAAETLKLERTLSDLLNRVYG